MAVSIPPAYESTGYRRFIGADGTMHNGRLAVELPSSLAAFDEPATATRPARTRLEFVGTPGGAVPLSRVITGTSPIRINGGASATLAADVTISILPANGGAAGSMSAADFTKLAGIEAGAINALAGNGLSRTVSTFAVVAHADGSIAVSGAGVQVGVLATDVQHGNRGRGSLHTNATTTEAGFMSASDKESYREFTGTTTDATTTAIATVALNDNTVYWFEARVICRDRAGVERAFYVRGARAHRQGGGAAVLGALFSPHSDESAAGLNAVVAVTGNNFVVNVTGLAATTIDWSVDLRSRRISALA